MREHSPLAAYRVTKAAKPVFMRRLPKAKARPSMWAMVPALLACASVGALFVTLVLA